MNYRHILKRGLKENLPVLDEGEIAYTTDTKEIFIGTSSGNVVHPNYEAIANKVDKEELEATNAELAESEHQIELVKLLQAGVLYVHPSGDNTIALDSAAVTSSGQRYYPAPFATILGATAVAQPGDTIRILPGGYNETGVLRSGITYIAERGAVLMDCAFTITSQPTFTWLGEADIVVTSGTSYVFNFNKCNNYFLELNDITNHNTTNPANALINADESYGNIEFRDGKTWLMSLVRINNKWTVQPKSIVKMRSGKNLRTTANVNSTTVPVVIVLHGAYVKIVAEETENHYNPVFAVGAINDGYNNVGTPTETKIEVCGGRHVSNVSDIFKYHGLTSGNASNKVILSETTRFSCSRFASLSASDGEWDIFILGNAFTNDEDISTVSAGATTVNTKTTVGSITVTEVA